MLHLPGFVEDLGVILITAAVVTLLFKWMRQPVVLGYLVAGFLVGPHFPLFPTVLDGESIQVWAEIGVIFLLFGLGLEFSFKKLAKIGKPASITALFEVFFMLSLGFLAGRILGWSTMDAVFLGGILSISSTTIIVRAFDEQGLKGRGFVTLVFGVLIVEDLIAILLLALLSTISVTRSLAGGELLLSGVRLGFFLVLFFLVGVYVVPLLLRMIRKLLNDETALLVSIGLCLLMVIAATQVGFSPALGAFLMGSILAETKEGSRIEHVITPVRDLFAAVFFVSVGMLIEPEILIQHGGVIVLISVITVFGKFFSTAMGALFSGQSLRHSVQSGMSMAQIGEFSFIIATLGLTLKVTSDFLYPVAVAVSALTTFMTPYLIRRGDFLAEWIERKLPTHLRERLNRYQFAFQERGATHSVFSLLWGAYGYKIVLNSVVIAAVFLAARKLLALQTGEQPWMALAIGILALIISAPFFWGLVLGPPAKRETLSFPDLERLKALQAGILVFMALISAVLFMFLVGQLTSIKMVSGILFVILGFGVIFLSRFAEPIYRFVEQRFLLNLNEKEREELLKARVKPELAPWNAVLAEFVLSPDSELVGKTLMESSLKEKFGVTIALIERGKKRIFTPGRTDLLMPYDRLYVVGTEGQLLAVKEPLEYEESAETETIPTFGLSAVRLKSGSRYVGKSIRNSGLRESAHGLIVGIERGGGRILNPDSSLILAEDDLLWVVGDREKMQEV